MDSKHENFSRYLVSLGFEKDDHDLYGKDPCLTLTYDMGNIIVVLCTDDSKFDIYYNFAYSDVEQELYASFPGIESAIQSEKYEGLFLNLWEDISKYWRTKALLNIAGKSPKEEFDECGIYCPGANEYLGFFSCDIDQDNLLPEQFVSIYHRDPNFSIDDIRIAIDNFLSDYLIDKGYSKLENMSFSSKTSKLHILRDRFQSYIDSRKNSESVESVYNGKEFRLFSTANRTVALDNSCFKEYEYLCQSLNWYTKEKIILDSDNRVIISNGLFNLEIQSHSDESYCRNFEYLYLMDSLEKFRPFGPSANLNILDFTRLTASEFEKLCYDCLILMGFENIHPIGRTTAADGGKDIFAEYTARSPVGTEIVKYIVQCKHSKTSLSREKIAEIPELLRENIANKYLLICSNDITPQTIDRLNRLNDRHANSITYWGKVEFSTHLHDYPQLIHQYKLLPEKYVPMDWMKYE